MMSNLGPEYASAIQGTETRTCHAAWSKLSEIFEGKNIGSISLALRNLTTFTSAGSSASKFLSDTAILSGVLMSVIPEDMKIGDLIKLLEIQTILNGLNDEYDSLRITLRSQIDNLSLNEINNRIFSEEAAMKNNLKLSYNPSSVLQVAERSKRKCVNPGCPPP